MQRVLFIVLTLLSGLLLAGIVAAAIDCRPIYGGGENCISEDKLEVDKKIQFPKSANFVDNLTEMDARYSARDIINFQVSITNKSGKTLSSVEAIDTLPKLIKYVSGPGKYNADAKTLTFKIEDLKNNETRKFIIVGRVENVPNPTCIVNSVRVKGGNSTADDNAKLCLEKSTIEAPPPGTGTTKGGQNVMTPPKGLTKTPATGPEMIPLIGLIPTALAGIYLRKRAFK